MNAGPGFIVVHSGDEDKLQLISLLHIVYVFSASKQPGAIVSLTYITVIGVGVILVKESVADIAELMRDAAKERKAIRVSDSKFDESPG
jgi:hypothetical protein